MSGIELTNTTEKLRGNKIHSTHVFAARQDFSIFPGHSREGVIRITQQEASL
eukprot:CAMPEP_0198281968 /NCGR_PEP_ID=MMETSP1449-20131203/1851_1 /TAXON_ID=420275 /ORGANISM="Attheya septentrionalis, Strain CCMP2084" /LENGTH=51 /DNA_ID=CAMNT_0043978011 /DNA_START=80 /DNA_END=231 /DNA_ORIENTATION=-